MRQTLTSKNQLFKILAARRRALQLSQQEVASKLGISQAYLSAIELGKRTLTFERLVELLHVLGLELAVQDRESPTATEW